MLERKCLEILQKGCHTPQIFNIRPPFPAHLDVGIRQKHLPNSYT
jgi:hypothetical protein